MHERGTHYDVIGKGYAQTRKEEPRFAQRILEALGKAQTVINVGAGTGSYEPTDRWVIAVEPSDVMVAQRRPRRVPALRSLSHELPFRDNSIDAAMCVLSLHHWDDKQQAGVDEMRRVARGPVVIMTCDMSICEQLWLKDYFPELVQQDRKLFPDMATLSNWLRTNTIVSAVPVPFDCKDWMLMSFWAHPERVLDAQARAATSGFARLKPEALQRGLTELESDLSRGEWDRRYGHLRTLKEYDAGLRLVVGLGSAL